MMDARGIPTAACPACGFTMFRIIVHVDPDTYEIDFYTYDAVCDDCGSRITLATPIDVPGYVR